jgi:toxin YoeB
MNLLWSEEGWEDYLRWQNTDRGAVRRINALIADIRRNRFAGIGKPEPLQGNLNGWCPDVSLANIDSFIA